jgi:hypothetical protein
MKLPRSASLAFVAFSLTAAAFAADAAGNWKWNITPPNGDAIEISLTLEMKDGKLSGTYHSPFGEAKISNATLKDNAIAFDVEREMNGAKFTVKYAGKLEGDAIKGTVELPGFDGGAASKMPWDAKRTK